MPFQLLGQQANALTSNAAALAAAQAAASSPTAAYFAPVAVGPQGFQLAQLAHTPTSIFAATNGAAGAAAGAGPGGPAGAPPPSAAAAAAGDSAAVANAAALQQWYHQHMASQPATAGSSVSSLIKNCFITLVLVNNEFSVLDS